MAQVGVQQPANLMEMFSSPSMMLGDIAAQQVNDQTLGNLLNRQQAQQSMNFDAQEQPFKLDQMGLANQTSRAQLPGVVADSSLKQDNATLSRNTMSEQQKAAVAKMAKVVSDSDYAVFENGVHQMRASSNPEIKKQGDALFPYIKAIATERDKLAIQSGNSLALAREQGNQARLTEQQAADNGKYTRAGSGASMIQNLNKARKPIEIDAILRQIVSDPRLSPEERAGYQARLEANTYALNLENQVRAIGQQGKVNPAEMTGLPGVTVPTAADTPAAAEPVQLTPQDQAALTWARTNPNDPRAAKILQKLKATK